MTPVYAHDRVRDLLGDLAERFADKDYQPAMRDRADMEFTKVVALQRIADALEAIDTRQRQAARAERGML